MPRGGGGVVWKTDPVEDPGTTTGTDQDPGEPSTDIGGHPATTTETDQEPSAPSTGIIDKRIIILHTINKKFKKEYQVSYGE
jgi:hypothetical protein